MKKIIITSAIFASTFALAQKVGINTSTPKTNLHITHPGATSSISSAKLSAGAIITGNSSVSLEGVGQYFENTSNVLRNKIVKSELIKLDERAIFGYARITDNARFLLSTIYASHLDTGNFTINIERADALGVKEKLDVNGNVRVRGLANGTDTNATTGFPNMLVAKTDGTLGYAPRTAGSIIKRSGTTSLSAGPVVFGIFYTDYVPVLIKNRAADNQTNTTFPKDHFFAYTFTPIGASWQLDFAPGTGNASNYTATNDVMIDYEVIFIPVAP